MKNEMERFLIILVNWTLILRLRINLIKELTITLILLVSLKNENLLGVTEFYGEETADLYVITPAI